MKKVSFQFFSGSTLICFILLLLFCGILIYNQRGLQNRLPDHLGQWAVTSNTNLKVHIGKEETTVSLPKGDSLKLLGYRKSSSAHGPELFVETKSGLRGFVSTIEMGYQHYRRTNDSFDTLTIIGTAGKNDSHKVNARFADGTTSEVSLSSLEAVLPDSILEWELSKKGWYYMSMKKFERCYMGKTLAEADAGYRPYTTLARTKSGWVASFLGIKVLDKKQGKLVTPIVTYNDSLVATSCEYINEYGMNKWLLKWWPLAGTIIDCDALSTLVQSPFYEHHTYGTSFTLAGGSKPWWMWVLAGIFLLAGLLWIICTPWIPALGIGAALQNRFSFYPLNDDAVEGVIITVTVIAGYIWFTLMLVWNLPWILAILFIPLVTVSMKLAMIPLNTRPHDRCLGCRRLYSMEYKERIWGETYEQWEVVTEKGDLLHQEHSSYKTWTETTYTDGSTSKSNEKTHHVTDSTYAIHHYNVLFRYHPYDDVYECKKCGQEERIHDHTKEELQRTYLSSGTTTTRSET